jgi:hypothetical protein
MQQPEITPATGARPPRKLARYAPLAVGAGLTLLAAMLYIRTLAPSVMPGDYAEFQFSAAILGVPHPTGYPLYILLGKLFTLLPFGDVAYRVNLSSAVYMAGAVGLLYALGVMLLRLLGWGRAWWAAAVGAALFAVAPTPWSMSLVARSYALNALLVGCVLVSLISWRTTGRIAWFFASLLFIGLSIVHHGTTYLLLPAYGLYLLWIEIERWRRRDDTYRVGRWAPGALSFLLGLSPILFLLYRFLEGGGPYYWGNPSSWKDFLSLLTGGPFQNQVLGYGTDLATQLSRIAFGIGELSNQYTPLGIALGLLGLGLLWRHRWAEAALLTLMMLANFAFAMNYSLVGYLYFIPTYLLWGIFMSIAVGGLAYLLVGRPTSRQPSAVSGQLYESQRTQRTRRAQSLSEVTFHVSRFTPSVVGRRLSVVAIAAAALAVALVFAISTRYPSIDQSGQTQTRDQTLALLNSAPQGATLYLDWEALSAVRYYRYVYGMRRDLTLHSGDPSNWAKAIYCDFTAGATPFVGTFAGATPANVQQDFTLSPAPMSQRVTGVTNASLYKIPACGTCATCR